VSLNVQILKSLIFKKEVHLFFMGKKIFFRGGIGNNESGGVAEKEVKKCFSFLPIILSPPIFLRKKNIFKKEVPRKNNFCVVLPFFEKELPLIHKKLQSLFFIERKIKYLPPKKRININIYSIVKYSSSIDAAAAAILYRFSQKI
jgi:hypothetical protein